MTMPTIIRSMDYGEGGPDYRIHYECTSLGCPAQTYGPPEHCYPADPPEWEITGIDAERWNQDGVSFWTPIEKVLEPHEVASVEHWAEMQDLSDECVEDAEAAREAALEFQAECRADALAEINRERNER